MKTLGIVSSLLALVYYIACLVGCSSAPSWAYNGDPRFKIADNYDIQVTSINCSDAGLSSEIIKAP